MVTSSTIDYNDNGMTAERDELAVGGDPREAALVHHRNVYISTNINIYSI